MLRCAALQSQKSGRDFAQLEGIAGHVVWTSDSAAADISEPLVISGLWLSDNHDYGRELLRRRSEAGRVSVLVPRWRAGDVAQLVGAFTPIDLRAGNFDGVAWEDGRQYAVSGVSLLRTALHAGRWAVAVGVGTAILCFRAHTTAGPIVICTAAVATRPPGIQVEEQRQLLLRIFTEASRIAGSSGPTKAEARPAAPAPDLETYLRDEGASGAALLLALIACQGDRKADLAQSSRTRLGVPLEEHDTNHLLRRLPAASTQEMAAALRVAGWGAHLRRVERAAASTETP